MYSTYLGGSGDDIGRGIAVDSAGNAYIAGETYSANFPPKDSIQPYGGGDDAFVTKLNASGSQLIYSTFLGGPTNDSASAIAVDSSGIAYETGNTNGSFPTRSGAYQFSSGGANDAFVVKISADGHAPLLYSSYIGGSGNDYGGSIAADDIGNVYVSGITESSNFPTTSGVFQPNFAGGWRDAYVTKISTTNTSPNYSTYLGGTASDGPDGLAIDSLGYAYIKGWTTSNNFPVHSSVSSSAYQQLKNGGQDAFVSKINPSGSALVYSTYLGGTLEEHGSGIILDSTGHAYITGFTCSLNFPSSSSIQPFYGGGAYDAFVTKLDVDGTALVDTTYLGGSSDDQANGIAIDTSGNIYVAGGTSSADFKVKNAYQSNNAGGSRDAFITKMQLDAITILSFKISPSSVVGGKSAIGTVTLSKPVPMNGFVVYLVSSDPTIVSVPYSVPVPVGASSVSFPILTNPVAATTKVPITATFDGSSKTTPITVTAASLYSLAFQLTSVIGGNTDLGTVKLNGAAPDGGAVVFLSSSNPAVFSVPSSVTTSAGAISNTFNGTAYPISVDTVVTVTANYPGNGLPKTTKVTVKAPVIKSFTITPSTVQGGIQNSMGTIMLTGVAPAGGIVVPLTSSDTSAATVPASVTVLAGNNTVDFTITSQAVVIQKRPVITATSTVIKAIILTVNP